MQNERLFLRFIEELFFVKMTKTQTAAESSYSTHIVGKMEHCEKVLLASILFQASILDAPTP